MLETLRLQTRALPTMNIHYSWEILLRSYHRSLATWDITMLEPSKVYKNPKCFLLEQIIIETPAVPRQPMHRCLQRSPDECDKAHR
jgi:hypothetical protein